MAHSRKRVFPVIHYLDSETTLRQAAVADSAGADGIFLIAHHDDDTELFMPAMTLKGRYPKMAIGVNFLGMSSEKALRTTIDLGLEMVWDDHPGVHSDAVSPEAVAMGVMLASSDDMPLYFGSFAFKGQCFEPDPIKAAMLATTLRMLPTTSGERTGAPPSVEKVRAIYSALVSTHGSDQRLAIASGMTVENISNYKKHATDFLVATGVSDNSYEFNEDRLKEFVRIVRSQS